MTIEYLYTAGVNGAAPPTQLRSRVTYTVHGVPSNQVVSDRVMPCRAPYKGINNNINNLMR